MIYPNLVLITGGTKGLGAALADVFVEKGFHVIVTSRKTSFSEDTTFTPRRIFTQYLDVTNIDSIKQLFAWLNSLPFQLKILVNNAGIGIFKPLHALSIADWQQSIDTNLTGAFLCTQAACKLMQANGGRIVNIGSIADKHPIAENAAYGVSKAGLKWLSAIINEEYKYKGIAATHVTLGATYTEIWHDRSGFDKNDMLNIGDVAVTIAEIAIKPSNMRIDQIEIFPPKGIL